MSATLRTLLGVLLANAVAEAAPPGEDEHTLRSLYYDFEVAAYCGPVTDAVGAAFQARTSALARRLALDRERIDALRGKAWQAAHAQWQNRGLGGFRAWCRLDGRRAAARFLADSPWRLTLSAP